jgi:hypothetical protein
MERNRGGLPTEGVLASIQQVNKVLYTYLEMNSANNLGEAGNGSSLECPERSPTLPTP